MTNHKYFNYRTRSWKPIPGMVCRVDLPILEAVPALRDHPLIIHRDLDTGEGWTVTHQFTSAAIAHGTTRADAITTAQETLLRYGNDAFLAAIADMERRLADAQKPKKRAAKIKMPKAG